MKLRKITVEYQTNPIGIDVMQPRFSWQLAATADDGRNVKQVAYQVQVSKEEDFFEENIVWDSYKMDGDVSAYIKYKGRSLESFKRYYIRIKAWSNKGEDAKWSELHYFETAFLDSSLWQADWISAPFDYSADKEVVRIFRKQFFVSDEIKKAKVYVSAKGLYELYINGSKTGEDYLTPGWTSYNKRLEYQTYDVTNQLKNGENAIGAMIGEGWFQGEIGWRGRRNFYGGRDGLILELHIEYENGKKEIILTDESWKSYSRGPITFSSIYHGEKYDARNEFDWSCPNIDMINWMDVRIMGAESKDILVSQESECVRIMDEIKPIEIITTPKGEKVIDFGQNFAGWVEFNVSGASGDKVVLSHAEILDPEGNFYIANLKNAKQQIEYTLKGSERETYRPHFTFQGFRYVRIDEFPGNPSLENFKGLVLYSAMESAGEFECSSPLVNQLYHNILWGQRSNFVDIPTDCPQRSERLGWTGDIQIFARTASYNMDIHRFLTKWLRDLAADQFESGGVPWVVPDIYESTYKYDLAGYYGQSEPVSAAWGDAAVICPWEVYLAYGDDRLLEEQYESMKKYIDFILKQGENPFLWNTGHQLGDWVALDAPYGSFIGATDVDFVATAYYAYSTKLLAKSAKIIGKEYDAHWYEGVYDNIVKEFRKTYIKPDGTLTVPTQTAIILAVYFDLVPEEVKYKLVEELAKTLEKSNYDLIVGFVGIPYICHVLDDFGQRETAYRLLLKTEYPSWLYQVTKGATTVWEHLDGLKPDGTLWNPRMNSFNHYAYGSVGDWLYGGIGGLKAVESTPGYKRFVFKPSVHSLMDYAFVSHQTLYGEIKTGWKSFDGFDEYYITVPENTEAEIVFPPRVMVFEKDSTLDKVDGIINIENMPNEQRAIIGSGSYIFKVIK